EARATDPMLPLRLFRSRPFLGANATAFLMIGSVSASVFLVAQYFQLGLGYSPMQTGLRLLPWTAAPLVLAPLFGKLSDRIGRRPFFLGFCHRIGCDVWASRTGPALAAEKSSAAPCLARAKPIISGQCSGPLITGSSVRAAHARPTFGSWVPTRGPETSTILPSAPSSLPWLPTGFPLAQTTGALASTDCPLAPTRDPWAPTSRSLAPTEPPLAPTNG